MYSQSLVALVVVPFVAQSVFAQTCARSYSVVYGDTCDGISASHNVSTYQLAVVNPSIDNKCHNLIPGQSLCLGYVGQDCQTTYVVAQNDSCDKISAASGTNNTLLYLNNPQINSDCTNIYVGEVLCVATSVQSPAPPSSGVPATTIPAGAVPANPTPAQSTPSPAQSTPAPAQTTPDAYQTTPDTYQTTPDASQNTPAPAQTTPDASQNTPVPSSDPGASSSNTSPATVVTASPGDPDFTTLPYCDEL